MNINSSVTRFRGGRRQSGATVVEFALLFPLLFGITYSTIVYGFVYYIQQTLNLTAEEAVRSAVSVDPGNGGTSGGSSAFLANLQNAASARINLSKNALGGHAITAATPTYSVVNDGVTGISAFQVQLTMPTTALGLPQVAFPGLGLFPPLPVALSATASAQIN